MRLLTPLSFFFFVCVCVFVELLPNGTNVQVPLFVFFFTFFFLRVVHSIYFSIFPPFAFFFLLPGKHIDSVITQFLVQRKS